MMHSPIYFKNLYYYWTVSYHGNAYEKLQIISKGQMHILRDCDNIYSLYILGMKGTVNFCYH